ncbi:MAG: hypothetical protein HLUCCA08_12365 [Rhodobacteraceae bacterium HLUCCA08]|nr:MAG: hypothetical protein HLUCCA08_12365 [Rhodobacteraceae bacterium HLUCCA08]
MAEREEIIRFWIDEVGPEGWYGGGAALDARIRDRYEALWAEARDGALFGWQSAPRGVLAYLILTDQFPRNMFRDSAAAFATDALARSAAKAAIDRRWDLDVPEPDRQFFYLPLMHSENLCDQDRCVRLMAVRMPEGGADNLRHARAHREVIRQFGRFPYRNAALGRTGKPAEAEWTTQGGYRLALAAVDAAAAA